MRKILVGLLAVGGVWAQNRSAASAANGKRLFEVKGCYECHGWRGQGGLAGARLAQTKLNLEGFRKILRNPPPSNMPPYRAAVLTDLEVADLFAYIQSFPAPEPVEKIPLLKD
jgi:ubiquinol-cytochrome c reductase cytochrome c subunit